MCLVCFRTQNWFLWLQQIFETWFKKDRSTVFCWAYTVRLDLATTFPQTFLIQAPTAYLYAPIIHDLVKLQHTVAECNIQWFPYNKHTIEIIFYHKYMGEEKIFSKPSPNLQPPRPFGKNTHPNPPLQAAASAIRILQVNKHLKWQKYGRVTEGKSTLM